MSVRRARLVLVTTLALCAASPAAYSAASHVAWQYEVQRDVQVGEASALVHADVTHLWTVEDGVLVHVQQWAGSERTEVLDGAGGPDGRVEAALRAPVSHVYGDQLHVYYVDVEHGDLRHAWRDGDRWHFAVLDGQDVGGGGQGSSATSAVLPELAAIVHHARPRVFYRSTDEAGVLQLRRARWTGERWNYRTLRVEDEPVQGLTAASAGRPHVWTAVQDGLRHLWWDGKRWREELVPAAMRTDRLERSEPVAGVDLDGRPHVVFEGAAAGDGLVQEVWWDGLGWRARPLGAVDSHCPCPVVRTEVGLQVWFNGTYDTNSGEVEMHHARLVDGQWQVERFGSDREPWGIPRTAAAAPGRLHVWYASDIWPRLWHGWSSSGR